jgi:hypothetical protein
LVIGRDVNGARNILLKSMKWDGQTGCVIPREKLKKIGVVRWYLKRYQKITTYLVHSWHGITCTYLSVKKCQVSINGDITM